MRLFTLDITRTDGTSAQVQTGQYAVAAAERWAARNGLRFDMNDPGPLAMTQLRVMAWAEDTRGLPAGKRPTFDDWDAQVDDVDVVSAGEPDPTGPATSAG